MSDLISAVVGRCVRFVLLAIGAVLVSVGVCWVVDYFDEKGRK
jgi:hypothetical protein